MLLPEETFTSILIFLFFTVKTFKLKTHADQKQSHGRRKAFQPVRTAANRTNWLATAALVQRRQDAGTARNRGDKNTRSRTDEGSRDASHIS